ncbi:hypothetical protein SLITO_v1c01960 [Spiroplasma litorale]|uniref:Uncharacterized protein n=1 Tax=Spiroplasma litorale TaxID=216942 RepID=A0A0K1W0M4_9MOLU|nr:hypothetical protein [Spiroplasma litorale]AKX33860.1 hypothetical protein SLITO_v1c01960 [Spiroplasma litorale]
MYLLPDWCWQEKNKLKCDINIKDFNFNHFETKINKSIYIDDLLRKNILDYNSLNLDGLILIDSFPKEFVHKQNNYLDKVIDLYVNKFIKDYNEAINFGNNYEVRQLFMKHWLKQKTVSELNLLVENINYDIFNMKKTQKKEFKKYKILKVI